MLPRTHRISTRDIARLFGRSSTQKISSYPFVYFVGMHPSRKNTKRGIQLSTKLSKSSVKRHILKRVFYDCVKATVISGKNTYTILAVPQKKRQNDIIQLLATGRKNTIVPVITEQFASSLSSFYKKVGSSVELNAQSIPSKKATDVLKKTKSINSK